MVKLGLTHPPAGAMALLFSDENLGWTHMAVALLGNVIVIAMATLINNSAELRQYPTSWGFLSSADMSNRLDSPRKVMVKMRLTLPMSSEARTRNQQRHGLSFFSSCSKFCLSLTH
jgi:CBS-domain-containing membrane protein